MKFKALIPNFIYRLRTFFNKHAEFFSGMLKKTPPEVEIHLGDDIRAKWNADTKEIKISANAEIPLGIVYSAYIHEMGHHFLTPGFLMKFKEKEPEVVNALEDVRMEKEMVEKFPNLRRVLPIGLLMHIQRKFDNYVQTLSGPDTIDKRVLLYIFHSYTTYDSEGRDKILQFLSNFPDYHKLKNRFNTIMQLYAEGVAENDERKIEEAIRLLKDSIKENQQNRNEDSENSPQDTNDEKNETNTDTETNTEAESEGEDMNEPETENQDNMEESDMEDSESEDDIPDHSDSDEEPEENEPETENTDEDTDNEEENDTQTNEDQTDDSPENEDEEETDESDSETQPTEEQIEKELQEIQEKLEKELQKTDTLLEKQTNLYEPVKAEELLPEWAVKPLNPLPEFRRIAKEIQIKVKNLTAVKSESGILNLRRISKIALQKPEYLRKKYLKEYGEIVVLIDVSSSMREPFKYKGTYYTKSELVGNLVYVLSHLPNRKNLIAFSDYAWLVKFPKPERPVYIEGFGGTNLLGGFEVASDMGRNIIVITDAEVDTDDVEEINRITKQRRLNVFFFVFPIRELEAYDLIKKYFKYIEFEDMRDILRAAKIIENFFI